MKNPITCLLLLILVLPVRLPAQSSGRINFDDHWKFFLGDEPKAFEPAFRDAAWRDLDLPHDWSIELPFDSASPTGNGGGALRGGIGWYRKVFSVPAGAKGQWIAISFDGIYRNSEVWVNGHYLGKRPYGYSSFQYELSPYLNYGGSNIVAVRVDNSQQPNSRWYSGSGIYRHVWLTTAGAVHITYNGTYLTTPVVSAAKARAHAVITLKNESNTNQSIRMVNQVMDKNGRMVISQTFDLALGAGVEREIERDIDVIQPALWSTDHPDCYKLVTSLYAGGKRNEQYTTVFGFRTYIFDSLRGFSLNGKPVKINGVCDHHDLGCLGSALNNSALRRQLQILKDMGCNGIRTSHNPPAPELLELCDEMGFIVMDEAFDMWKKEKTTYDYHLDWDQWHRRDLEDQVIRDRNHPSVFIWSIGNEVMEQWDKSDNLGAGITTELAGIVRSLDNTRPITAACNSPYPDNPLIRSGALDLIGYNYEHRNFPDFHKRFPGKKFIATETVSALASRGHYDMPSDSIRRWPERWDKPLAGGNPDLTCSDYDNCSTPWGSTQEETWKIVRKYDFLSGQFIWTGFDYLGEPTPYPWPARSSYFGIVDLAGFPKNSYYMYQSEWTGKPVLHLLPHWNWKQGDTIDVWAYYNNADEVELFLNERSLGKRSKSPDDLHVWWRVAYVPGTLKAISRKKGKQVLIREIHTAGVPYRILLEADRSVVHARQKELCFVTAKIVDQAGNPVPDADNLVRFSLEGPGLIAGVDNGLQTDLSPFKADWKKAFNGRCLVLIQAKALTGSIRLTASAAGLDKGSLAITVRE